MNIGNLTEKIVLIGTARSVGNYASFTKTNLTSVGAVSQELLSWDGEYNPSDLTFELSDPSGLRFGSLGSYQPIGAYVTLKTKTLGDATWADRFYGNISKVSISNGITSVDAVDEIFKLKNSVFVYSWTLVGTIASFSGSSAFINGTVDLFTGSSLSNEPYKRSVVFNFSDNNNIQQFELSSATYIGTISTVVFQDIVNQRSPILLYRKTPITFSGNPIEKVRDLLIGSLGSISYGFSVATGNFGLATRVNAQLVSSGTIWDESPYDVIKSLLVSGGANIFMNSSGTMEIIARRPITNDSASATLSTSNINSLELSNDVSDYWNISESNFGFRYSALTERYDYFGTTKRSDAASGSRHYNLKKASDALDLKWVQSREYAQVITDRRLIHGADEFSRLKFNSPFNTNNSHNLNVGDPVRISHYSGSLSNSLFSIESVRKDFDSSEVSFDLIDANRLYKHYGYWSDSIWQVANATIATWTGKGFAGTSPICFYGSVAKSGTIIQMSLSSGSIRLAFYSAFGATLGGTIEGAKLTGWGSIHDCTVDDNGTIYYSVKDALIYEWKMTNFAGADLGSRPTQYDPRGIAWSRQSNTLWYHSGAETFDNYTLDGTLIESYKTVWDGDDNYGLCSHGSYLYTSYGGQYILTHRPNGTLIDAQWYGAHGSVPMGFTKTGFTIRGMANFGNDNRICLLSGSNVFVPLLLNGTTNYIADYNPLVPVQNATFIATKTQSGWGTKLITTLGTNNSDVGSVRLKEDIEFYSNNYDAQYKVMYRATVGTAGATLTNGGLNSIVLQYFTIGSNTPIMRGVSISDGTAPERTQFLYFTPNEFNTYNATAKRWGTGQWIEWLGTTQFIGSQESRIAGSIISTVHNLPSALGTMTRWF